MAIIDDYLEFADGQSVATNAKGGLTFQIGDIVNLGVASPNIGEGTSLWFHLVPSVKLAGMAGTVSTVTFLVQHSPSATAASFTTLLRAAKTTSATSTGLGAAYSVGTQIFDHAVPGKSVQGYLRMCMTTTATISAGTVDAWMDLQTF